MSFYLRVEGINQGNFINDTNDISTTRGGGLLLLEAIEKVEKIIKSSSPPKVNQEEKEITTLEKELNELNSIQNPTQSDKNKKKKLREKLRKLKDALNKTDKQDCTPTITKGASWGLFDLDMTDEEAVQIKTEVIKFFKSDALYKHATFVVDLYHGGQDYQKDRDCVQTLNRWQQLQAPSLAICIEGTKSCAIDKIRPASTERWLKDDEEGKDYVSESVYLRRKYGIEQKQKFYKKMTEIDAKFTNDLNELSKSADKGILDGKIAYIYIDGNGFGKLQRDSKTPKEQQDFDNNTRHGRECLLANILGQITTKSDWLTHDGKVRFETLLWGGDEIIWVVPAWQGWWMVNEFYKQAKQHIKHNNNPLFHAAGLVFCHHNAPIHRIDTLARNLANQFAKVDRSKNLIAYQVLKSFDHAGTQLNNHRKEAIKGLGSPGDLLVEAEKFDDVCKYITELKKYPDFARRKIYQILQAYKEEKMAKAEEYQEKLPDTCIPWLKELKKIFGGENAHWLHLMDMWDYMDGDHND